MTPPVDLSDEAVERLAWDHMREAAFERYEGKDGTADFYTRTAATLRAQQARHRTLEAENAAKDAEIDAAWLAGRDAAKAVVNTFQWRSADNWSAPSSQTEVTVLDCIRAIDRLHPPVRTALADAAGGG